MKRIYYLIFAVALAAFASCQTPEYVEPTAERQGITSLTAYFTSGKYVEKEMGKLVVADPETDRYVIPIPWYYPEESDDETILHMSKVRVRAELAPNCKIDPPLTILDLFQEHQFTFTNAQGESKPITITGQRVHSSTADMLSMNLIDPATGSVVIEGFVDNDEKTVYLFSVEDLSGLVAEVKPWYHASVLNAKEIMDEESQEGTGVFLFSNPRDWNQEEEITILADDEVSTGVFKVVKRDPQKIPYGFNAESVKEMFNIDPVSRLGVPAYITPVNASIAYLGGYLVVSHGDGSVPIYLDGRNGSKLGEIAAGGLTVGAVTNDEGGNMLLCNHLDAAGVLEIYKTRSVTEAPVLFYSYNSEVSLPIGAKIKVCGNIDTEARITISYEGVAGVTEASQFVEFVVEGGEVVSAQVYDVAGSGFTWGSYPENSAGLVPCSSKAGEDGWFYASYPLNGMQWIKPDLSPGQQLLTDDMTNAWLLNPNCLESKTFNKASYLTLLVCHHFPAWDKQPSLWIYDINDPATVSGNYQNSSSLVAYNSWLIYFNAANADGNLTQSSGDVVMAPSADGFKVYIYYYDHYAGMIGGYSADCVKK